MKPTSITIQNFKSIKDISINLSPYGSGKNMSNTSILLGVNESGKSNILEAIRYLNEGFNGAKYNDLACKNVNKSEYEYVDLFIHFELRDEEVRKELKGKTEIPTELITKIRFKDAWKNTWLKRDETFNDVDIQISVSIEDYSGYYFENDCIVNVSQDIVEFEKLHPNAEKLSEENLSGVVSKLMRAYIFSNCPKVIYWRSSREYLISADISLSSFSADPTICIPLMNLFHMNGNKDVQSIASVINVALSNSESNVEFKRTLTDIATNYVNNIWKEHNINVNIEFNGDSCSVLIEDKEVKNKLYTMDKRSDGFRQFISLILSLSAENAADKLKNAIILLDEPEVHLHPSGIRYMRDELIKIGKNNHVIVTTHSPYMVDTLTPERHLIVEKRDVTTISQIQDGNVYCDEVLSKAFGLNLMKELLPDNILIVEGAGDSNIIGRALHIMYPNKHIIIKHAGGCSKVIHLAGYMSNENITSFIILDDDKEGRAAKDDVVKKLKPHYSRNNTFTLKDISNSIVEKGTIEDLLNVTYVNAVISEKENKNITLNENRPIIEQLKNIMDAKDKIDSLKTHIAESFMISHTTAESLKDHPKLRDLINNLITKF